MPAKQTFQSVRVRGPAEFDQAIRVKGHDWPPADLISSTEALDLNARKVEKSANLSDLGSASAARGNLGLGSAATKNAAAAGTSGAVLNADDPTTTNARPPTAHTHDASDLTSLPAHAHAASDITGGTFPDARIASAATWNAKGEANTGSQSTLGADFPITAAAGTFVDTGLAVALPSAGTYLLLARVRGVLKISAGAPAWLMAKMRNTTDGADIASSELLIVLTETTGTLFQTTGTTQAIVTVDGAKTIKLYAARGGSGATFTTSTIGNDANGRTSLMAVRLG